MTTPRRYNRFDAIRLVSTTLGSIKEVELERDDLRRHYPSTNFGYTIRSRHRDLGQAKTSIKRAYDRLVEKLRTLPGKLVIKDGDVLFEGKGCNYALTIDTDQTDWDGSPLLEIGIFSGGSGYRF